MALCEPPEHIDGVGPDPGITAVAVGLPAEAYPSCAPPVQAGRGHFVHERSRDQGDTIVVLGVSI